MQQDAVCEKLQPPLGPAARWGLDAPREVTAKDKSIVTGHGEDGRRLTAARQGHPPGGAKLLAHADWVRKRMSVHGETTLDELCVALAERGIEVHLHRLGLSNKKASRQASSADRGSPGRVTFGSIAESGSSTRPCRRSSLSMRLRRTHV